MGRAGWMSKLLPHCSLEGLDLPTGVGQLAVWHACGSVRVLVAIARGVPKKAP